MNVDEGVVRRLGAEALAKCISLLPHDVHKVLQRPTLDGKPDGAIAGGFVRDVVELDQGFPPTAMWCAPKDIDVFFRSKAQAETFRKQLGGLWDEVGAGCWEQLETRAIPIQVIHSRKWTTLGELITSFDFRCCQAAFWWGAGPRWEGFNTQGFIQDVRSKRLVLAEGTDAPPANSMLRAHRFMAKGWTMLPSEVSKLVIAIARARGKKATRIDGDFLTSSTRKSASQH